MRILKLLIYSNFLVSLSAGFLAYACTSKLGNSHQFGIGFIAFGATLFTYNIQRVIRIKEIKKQTTDRHRWLIDHVFFIKILSGLGLIAAVLIYFFVLGWDIDFWFLAISAMVGVLYAFKVVSKYDGLRDIPYIKIFLIAAQWALVVVYWPYLRSEGSALTFPWDLCFSVFFYILANTICFDIRDLVYDDQKKRTIPQVFGVKGAKAIALIFLVSSFVLLVDSSPNILHSWLLYVSFLISVVLILLSQVRRHEMYFSGLIDGWIISYAALILLM